MFSIKIIMKYESPLSASCTRFIVNCVIKDDHTLYSYTFNTTEDKLVKGCVEASAGET